MRNMLSPLPLSLLLYKWAAKLVPCRLRTRLFSSKVVARDELGCPIIVRKSVKEAFRMLGYAMAEDRAFQLELWRRISKGQLAEMVGHSGVNSDILFRSLQLQLVAESIVAQLPQEHRDILTDVVEGMNGYLLSRRYPSIEHRILEFPVTTWTLSDSILIGLLTTWEFAGQGDEENERMMTKLTSHFDEELVAFLTPDSDSYSSPRTGGQQTRRPPRSLPIEQIARELRNAKGRPLAHVDCSLHARASTCIATHADGRSYLLNDLHQGLSTPCPWYKALIVNEQFRFSGLFLPSLPVPISGTNGKVAWGVTATNGDFLDLVKIKEKDGSYLTADGWKPIKKKSTQIRVRNAPPQEMTVEETDWGPILPKPLQENRVAAKWVGLDPTATDLNLLELYKAEDAKTAAHIFKRSGGPPLNAVVIDTSGERIWTVCGKFPIREGFSGLAATDWSDGQRFWRGYIPSEELPSCTAGGRGSLVSANDTKTGALYPYSLGHHFGCGFRAHHATKKMSALSCVDEAELAKLSLDTSSDFYDFYRALVISCFKRASKLSRGTDFTTEISKLKRRRSTEPIMSEIGQSLVKLRQRLAQTFFGAVLSKLGTDHSFIFRHNFEEPLRATLRALHPSTNPLPEQFASWEELILTYFEESIAEIRNAQVGRTESTLHITHPLFRGKPPLAALFDLEPVGMQGDTYCMHVQGEGYGSSARVIVSLNDPMASLFHLSTGESGNPLSPHYCDQFKLWREGRFAQMISLDWLQFGSINE